MVESIIYRHRSGLTWRHLPRTFGPWQTVWASHRRLAAGGTFVLDRLLPAADAVGRGELVGVGGLHDRPAHQHVTNVTRTTGGFVELHGSATRAA